MKIIRVILNTPASRGLPAPGLPTLLLSLLLFSSLLLLPACSRDPDAATAPSVSLILNWVPEPEFGGFYAAQLTNAFSQQNLTVTIQPGGSGTPALDLVAVSHADFAIASADEVVIARARGMDVVALFAVYQTCPQGIMTHQEAGYDSLASLFAKRSDQKTANLAMELGLPYVKFLKNKYGFENVNLVPFAGGIAQFMADPLTAQQCFVTSEPLSVRKQPGNPQPRVFLIADSGYNPYTAVVVTSGKTLRDNPKLVRAFVTAVTAGWQSYLHDPAPANQLMHDLNPTLDLETFAAAAEAQKPLIQSPAAPGSMTAQRWQTLIDQMKKLGVISEDIVITPSECFVNPTAEK